jgi:hypothetical protein
MSESKQTAKERLLSLIDEYFDIGFDEGVEGRVHDTIDGRAQKTRTEIETIISSIAVCQTCDGTGMEARHSICRDCDELPLSPPTREEGVRGND